MALFLSVELGDSIRIGRNLVTIEVKSGRRVRLRIDSDDDIEHLRPGEEPASPDPDPPGPPGPERLTRPSLTRG